MPRPYRGGMSEYIENLDVYAASSYKVAISGRNRVTRKVGLKARVDASTGEVRFFIPLDDVDVLRG
jgi:hypothetical protein